MAEFEEENNFGGKNETFKKKKGPHQRNQRLHPSAGAGKKQPVGGQFIKFIIKNKIFSLIRLGLTTPVPDAARIVE